MKNKKIIGICLMLIFSLMLAAGCGASKTAQSTAKKTSTKLVMATNATFPPFESVKVVNGAKQFEGLDLDIANYIAKDLGFTYTVNDMAFSGIVGSLIDKRADFAISGISPTPERLKNVDFSTIYFYPRNAIVYLKGANYTTMDKLQGKKIAVPFGTTYESDAKKVQGANVVALDGSPAVIQEINNKRADAAIIDGAEAVQFLKKNPGLAMTLMAPTKEAKDSFAIAFPKGSKWVAPFNKELKKMQDNGEMDKLIVKWLGKQYAQQ